MTSARALLLAGPSCSGKTELGLALQQVLPEPWLLWAADVAQPRFPRRNEFVTSEADMQMVEGNLRSIGGYLDVGFNVIAELFIWEQRRLEIARRVLHSHDVFVLRLDCTAETLERRERVRGTTYLGFVREQLEKVSWSFTNDLTLDTAAMSPQELAATVSSWLASNPQPQVFT